MTIGWWVMAFGVVLCLFMAPLQSLAIIGVAVMPLLIAAPHKWWSWVIGIPLYLLGIFGAGWYILLAEEGMQLVLYPMMALVIIASWAVTLDNV